ncbi:MAG: DUF721 domain-containing protein [Alphaproteobacteria bacterium]|nr:DUF721 domain-containing protein [Alphaproteobacteria bacterium]
MTDEDIKIPERQREMRSLAMSILPLARKLVGKKGMLLADLLVAWEKIVGKQMAFYTCPEKIDYEDKEKSQAVLKLRVANGAFALEVQHNKEKLLEKINAYLGRNAIVEIKIIQDGALCLSGFEKNNQPHLQKNLVSAEEQNYIDELSEGITNVNLKEKLAKLGKAVFSSNK